MSLVAHRARGSEEILTMRFPVRLYALALIAFSLASTPTALSIRPTIALAAERESASPAPPPPAACPTDGALSTGWSRIGAALGERGGDAGCGLDELRTTPLQPAVVTETVEEVTPPVWTFPQPSFALPLSVPDKIRRFEPEILAAAEAHGVDPVTIAALISIESSGNPRAVSYAGALGLMQVMPNWFGRGEDPFDPATNIMRGTGIFRQNLDELGDESLALAAYLSGSNSIRAHGAVPGFALPYVQAVVAERERFRSAA